MNRRLIPQGNIFPLYPKEPYCSQSLKICPAFSNQSLSLSFSPRCFHHLLAPILHHSHPEHALRLQHPPSNVQRLYVAWICQQCCQPNYLHHLQHWISQSFHEDPPLLKVKTATTFLRIRKKKPMPFTHTNGQPWKGLELLYWAWGLQCHRSAMPMHLLVGM